MLALNKPIVSHMSKIKQNGDLHVEAVSVNTELSSTLFTVTSSTPYSVPAASPVITTDVESLEGVCVLILPPSLTVTLYPVNLSDPGVVHVTVSASSVLVVTTRLDG